MDRSTSCSARVQPDSRSVLRRPNGPSVLPPPSRLDKLGVKAGSVVMTVALTDEEFLDDMKGRGARIVTRAPKDGVEIVFYGAERREALDRLPRLSEAMRSNGALWVIRPKGQRAITELTSCRPESAPGSWTSRSSVSSILTPRKSSSFPWQSERSIKPGGTCGSARPMRKETSG